MNPPTVAVYLYTNYLREHVEFFDLLAFPRPFGSNETETAIFDSADASDLYEQLECESSEIARFPHGGARYYPTTQPV